MSESWVEKFRPESWDEIQGNNKDLEAIEEWAESWSEGDEPQLLVGPAGTGKTTTALVASDTMGYPINEINASDARRAEDIERVAGSMASSPVDGEYQLVLLDEVDNWHSSAKITPLVDELKDPSNPIILTANEEYEVPGSVKRAAKVREYSLGVRSRRAKIRKIAEAEGLDLDQQDLDSLAERPDLRSAINDLQDWAGSDLPPGQNERTESIGEFGAVDKLLSGDVSGWREAVGVSDDSFRGAGSAIYWADENLSQEFRGLEEGVAYDVLSRADKWLPNARNQNFRYQKYSWALLGMLPETRLSIPYDGYINVDFPEWWRHDSAHRDDESPEAQLYQELDRDRGYSFAASFYEFQERYLPLLRDEPQEVRKEMALNNGLSLQAIEALDLDPDDFEEWKTPEDPEEGDGWEPDVSSAADW